MTSYGYTRVKNSKCLNHRVSIYLIFLGLRISKLQLLFVCLFVFFFKYDSGSFDVYGSKVNIQSVQDRFCKEAANCFIIKNKENSFHYPQ